MGQNYLKVTIKPDLSMYWCFWKQMLLHLDSKSKAGAFLHNSKANRQRMSKWFSNHIDVNGIWYARLCWESQCVYALKLTYVRKEILVESGGVCHVNTKVLMSCCHNRSYLRLCFTLRSIKLFISGENTVLKYVSYFLWNWNVLKNPCSKNYPEWLRGLRARMGCCSRLRVIDMFCVVYFPRMFRSAWLVLVQIKLH